MSTESSTDRPAEHGAQGHGEHPAFLVHHFDSPVQQFEAAKLGMWIFIATEILMFGGLFVAYGIWRSQELAIFHQAASHLDKIMGATNTVVLLFSSLTAALSVRASQRGERTATTNYLVVTILCACVFLVVKYFEYTHKLHLGLLPGRCFGHPWFTENLPAGISSCLVPTVTASSVEALPTRAGQFFSVYFMMTGLHGLHVLIGMSVLIWVLVRNLRGDFSPKYFTAVEIGALYWHLVDLVWIYLFPLLYLVG